MNMCHLTYLKHFSIDFVIGNWTGWGHLYLNNLLLAGALLVGIEYYKVI